MMYGSYKNSAEPLPRFPWEKDPNPRIQELDDERALLLCQLGVENDPAMVRCCRDLIFALEEEIAVLRAAVQR